MATRIPITLEDYLAVRLWVAKIDAEIYPEDNDTSTISYLATIHLVKSMEKAGKRTCKSIR
jgi:hypothetical protein